MKRSGKAQRKPVTIPNVLGLFSLIRIIKQWVTRRIPGKSNPGKLFRDSPFPLLHKWPEVLHVKWRRKDPATARIVKVLQPPTSSFHTIRSVKDKLHSQIKHTYSFKQNLKPKPAQDKHQVVETCNKTKIHWNKEAGKPQEGFTKN